MGGGKDHSLAGGWPGTGCQNHHLLVKAGSLQGGHAWKIFPNPLFLVIINITVAVSPVDVIYEQMFICVPSTRVVRDTCELGGSQGAMLVAICM